MRKLHCWICGEFISTSAVAQDKPFYLEIRHVIVRRPYGYNSKTKPVFVCTECALTKVGIDQEGGNLNP